VEHLIIGLSFEICVTQGKCPLNVTCPGVGNVHDVKFLILEGNVK